MLVGSGSVIWIYRYEDLDLKEILSGADPDRAFHFDVDPDLASQNLCGAGSTTLPMALH
jgi:hypothetical protein